MGSRLLCASLLLVSLFLAACGTTAGSARSPAAVPTSVEMDTMKLEAKRTADGFEIDSYDAAELFERGSKALSDNRLEDAVKFYEKLLRSFPESPMVRSTLYNLGLAHRDRKAWTAAIEVFRTMAERFAAHPDSKDALFQLGACYAEREDWIASREVFAQLLARKDLTADDRIEAMARRGFAQLNMGDLETAEATFLSTLIYRQTIDKEERLATDFFLAFSQYNLGQILHARFKEAPIRLPESQMEKDLDAKASLLLKAQRRYIEAIKYGHPGWASAAGFQVGTLYEELYDAFMAAPVPSELLGEAREVYLEELHKKIKILLEKSLRWYRENLLMIERLGVDTDWAQKSKVAYAKLMKLLEPAGKDVLGQPVPVPVPGVVPPMPTQPPTPSPGDPRAPVNKMPTTENSVQRQIL